MRLLSSTCLAIAAADRNGTLRLVERVGRLGPYIAITDDHGLIEVALAAARPISGLPTSAGVSPDEPAPHRH